MSLKRKFINQSFETIKSKNAGDVDEQHVAEMTSSVAYKCIRSGLTGITEALRSRTDSAPKKGEGTLAWLIRQSINWNKQMKEMLSHDTYKGIYDDNFYRWDSPEGFAVIASFYSSSFGISDIEHSNALESAASKSELDKYPYSGSLEFELNENNLASALREAALNYIEGSEDILKFSRSKSKVKRNYLGHYGFYKYTPLVTESMRDFYESMTLRAGDLPDHPTISREESIIKLKEFQSEAVAELFTEMSSQLSRLCKPAPDGPYRPFLEGSALVPGNYQENPFMCQEHLKFALSGHPDLLYLETQSRKIGPRKPGSQEEFWKQVRDSYDVPVLDEEAKADLANAADECIKLWLDKVGKVEPIPYVVGINQLSDIQYIYSAVHSYDQELANEGYKVWTQILKNSLGAECVYSHIKKNTNKGAPYYTHKIKDIEWLNLIYSFYNRSSDPLASLNTFPFLPGQRLQNSTPVEDGEGKVRDRIIMQMSAIYIAHQAYNIPLLKAMKEMDEFVSYNSHESVGYAMEEAVKDLDPNLRTFLLSQDYSGYDKCLGGELAEPAIWKFFESIFVNTKGGDHLHNLFSGEWKHFYTQVPLIVPGGVKTGPHGLFSGAPGTTIIGSIMNWIRTRAMAKHFNIKFIFNYFQGDDTALCYQAKEQVELTDISAYLAKFGHVVQADAVKQAYMEVKQDSPAWIMFVGKYYFMNSISGLKLFKPIYSVVDMVARFVHPEAAKMSIDERTIRDWSEYDYNRYKYTWKNLNSKDKFGEKVIPPYIAMAVRLTQSLMNIENHPMSETIIEDLVHNAPGLFKGLVDYANVASFFNFSNDGTLVGMANEEMRDGFMKSPTVLHILRILTEVKHNYENVIYMEDLTEAIRMHKITRDRIENSDSPQAAGSILGNLKDALYRKFGEGILSTKAYNDLKSICRDMRPEDYEEFE